MITLSLHYYHYFISVLSILHLLAYHHSTFIDTSNSFYNRF
nr:MAG TPA: hypothetical protein [Caudoviricetes sp.]